MWINADGLVVLFSLMYFNKMDLKRYINKTGGKWRDVTCELERMFATLLLQTVADSWMEWLETDVHFHATGSGKSWISLCLINLFHEKYAKV